MRILEEVTLAEISTGDIVAIHLPGMCVSGTVTATSPAQRTLSFVPFARTKQPESGTGFGITWFQQPATIQTIGLNESGIKLSKAVDSEAGVTYPLTWESIAELEPGVAILLTEIQGEYPTEWNYVRIWYGYKERLSGIVGWGREEASHPELRSSEAYNVVYHNLLDCLINQIAER
jgi:hypothetical protein